MTSSMQKGNYGSIDVTHPTEQEPLIGVGDVNGRVSNGSSTTSSKSRHSLPLTLLVGAAIIGVIVVVFNLSASRIGNSLRTNAGNATVSTSISQVSANVGVAPAKKEKLLYSNTPRFYDDQLVDHFDRSNTATWSQRYYAKRVHFAGPGHPIFLVIGGEGANDVGMFYPFVEKVMAKQFGAYVIHPEHRFYGISQPIPDRNASVPELLQLLTPEQSMMDMLRLAQHYRVKLGCSLQKSSKKYCPIITVGGSYPGFLAAMMRLLYPEHIEMAYASSAPMKLYSKDANQWGYFEILTEAAERVSPGCPAAVKQALTEFDSILQDTTDFLSLAYDELNICPGSVPKYIDSGALFSQELIQIIETSFADANMIGNYPPSNHTWFAQLCQVFQNDTTTYDKFRNFWLNLEIQDYSRSCFAMDYQMSEGSKATISSADWSGLGPGRDGRMWDFQCCTSLTPEMGFSHKSMFPYRKWTYEWLTEHCVNRFGVVGDPYEMVKAHHFNDLVGQGASRIIFTNGGNDMWMAGSYTQNLSDSIIAITMPNGGHHSEVYARPDDLPDIKEAQREVEAILGGWLQDIKNGIYE
jgi:pimeloyl-ACP methyl ester carboxylesterase